MRVLNFVRLVAAMAVVVAVASGCDRGEQYGTVTGPSATPSVSAVPTPPPSPAALDPARQAVVDRYLLYVRTLEKLYETTDPSQVDMAAVSTGAQFRNDVETVLRMRNKKIHIVGRFDNRITLKQFLIGGGSVILNCQGLGSIRTIKADGSVAPSPTHSSARVLQNVNLVQEKGQWKVSRIQVSGEC
ncbi:MAG: hypothetical protein JWO79_2770 [Actinomycetia bacterium]|nr:hypothetical protein [Actinomycetes bacterium]